MRRNLPFRTVFNLIGPLCNPASPGYQLIGVPDDRQAGLVAEALSRQPHIRRAFVVTGSDGLDEITLEGPTIVRVVEPGRVEITRWAPEEFGLSQQAISSLVIANATESGQTLLRILEGEASPACDYVVANTAAALAAATGCNSARGGQIGGSCDRYGERLLSVLTPLLVRSRPESKGPHRPSSPPESCRSPGRSL